mmetsp:Transcript_4863/g.18005  ORF Transcript_4863/g.18005 Transcript_4863/m.18005 type:complete len:200 (-) Transcript_4863:128-727(-)
MLFGGDSWPCENPRIVRFHISRPKCSSSALKTARSALSTRHPSRRSMYTTACTSLSFMASFTEARPRCDTWSPSIKPGVSKKDTVNPAACRDARSGRSDSGWNGALCATRSFSTLFRVDDLPAPCFPTKTTVISVWFCARNTLSASIKLCCVCAGMDCKPTQSFGPSAEAAAAAAAAAGVCITGGGPSSPACSSSSSSS